MKTPEFKTLRFVGKSFEDCVAQKLNPNPDEGGLLFPLGTREEIREKARAAAQRIIKAMREDDASPS